VDEFDRVKTNFPHPTTGEGVWYIPDAVHMMKLARNALGAYDIQSPEGCISFKFIKYLHEIQIKLRFKLDNKIGLKHIHYKRNAMKVNIACETLSNSTASAIEYLESSGVPEMQGSGPTVRFIRTINFLFDVLNSKSQFERGDKAVLTRENLEEKR
jgi:hypothetical protein